MKIRVQNQWRLEQEDSRTLSKRIADILLSENLVVLTGLGTSLCLKDAGGAFRAPTMKTLWQEIEAKVSQPKMQAVMQTVHYSGSNIEALLSHAQMYASLTNDNEIKNFSAEAETRIFELCSFLHAGERLEHHEQFLLRLARRSSRQPRMKLFTTNYDLCFESAAANLGFVVIDGFSHSHPQRFDGGYFAYDLVRRDNDRDTPEYAPNVFHLYKLHGSVDWGLGPDGVAVRDGNPARPMMIYPRVAKFELSYQQPYFEMMSRFQSALRQPNLGLLVMGFGFLDSHLAQPLYNALRMNAGLKCVVVTPAFEELDTVSNEGLASIVRLVDQGDTRVTAVSGKFEDLTPLIPDLNG